MSEQKQHPELTVQALEKLLEMLSTDYVYSRELKSLRVKTPAKVFIQKTAEFTIKYLRVTTESELATWKEVYAPSETEEKRVYDFFVTYGSAFVAKRFQIKISDPL